MDNAELYEKGNNMQKRDALESLQDYADKIKWKQYGARILDIGSGDGTVTTRILKEYTPQNYKIIVGCDVSEKMVQFANDNHGNERTRFILLNIENYPPKELMGSFDHVVSFYTLHWIKNQKSAFMNIFDLMTEDGSCFLIFCGRNPIFDVYRTLSKRSIWRPWLENVDRFISPYHDSEDPEKEITQMLDNIGFRDIYVTCKKKHFVFDSADAIKSAVKAVNPFSIPSELYNDFLEDYLEVVRRMRIMDEANNNQSTVKYEYDLIIVHASK
ncbi:juvenile hormone acid O-methyltransferase [Plodia interpunctella]|uniref:juvenile hormone acid O-methyltransferase n=1 Tax=Plodia interpunctella TaxID=58824 RepID=UPI002368A529|nr:juvenile hormone acid O-methyltransferase [Plodia interpunctella]